MKAVKLIVISLVVYIGIVVAFESLIGFFQPENQTTLVITTTDEDGNSNDRVLARLVSNHQLFVAANHWPRAWYKQALANPRVEVTIDDKKTAYLAAPVTDAEHDRVAAEHSTGVLFRILTGFPQRTFLRLDPL